MMAAQIWPEKGLSPSPSPILSFLCSSAFSVHGERLPRGGDLITFWGSSGNISLLGSLEENEVHILKIHRSSLELENSGTVFQYLHLFCTPNNWDSHFYIQYFQLG